MKSRLMRLVSIPEGMPQPSNFQIEHEELGVPANGELLLKPIYISVDPYLRAAMSGGHPPNINAGDIIISRGIAEVVRSSDKRFLQGDFVMGYMEWRDILIAKADGLIHLKNNALPLSTYLSVLGSTGLSAYFSLIEIGKPKRGETMIVSGAAGAVGSIAGQIGKILGCKVIGIVGSEEKAQLITSAFQFDAAINYKTNKDINAAIHELCPEGIDIYFDNVGGTVSDAVISNMNDYGRVVVCGTIADYNNTMKATGPRLLPLVVFKKLLIQGFLIGDYKNRFEEGRLQLQQWLAEDKIHYTETIMEGFEQLPDAFIGLFNGTNKGKMLVKISSCTIY